MTARVIHETCRTYDIRKVVVNQASNQRQLGGCRTVCVNTANTANIVCSVSFYRHLRRFNFYKVILNV